MFGGMSGLRASFVASASSQFYSVTLGMLVVPLYLKYMGLEAYGLIGVYATLQSWFSLLDAGLTPLLGRQVARWRAGAVSPVALLQFVRSMEWIFIGIASIACLAAIPSMGMVADLLGVGQRITRDEVVQALTIMVPIIALRWITGFHRAIITGAERIVLLGAMTAGFSTLRFLGILPVFMLVGTDPATFFLYQLMVAVVELVCLSVAAHRQLPRADQAIVWNWRPLRESFGLSLTIAFTAGAWVAVVNIDKLVLSTMLPLSEYAVFTIAIMAAGGINLIVAPMVTVVQPRLTRLVAMDDAVGAIQLYRQISRFIAVIAGSAGIVLALFSERILLAWIGDPAVVENGGMILALYAIGNGLLACAAPAYLLQFAHGRMRLHTYGTALLFVLLVPAIIIGASKGGAQGAAWVWASLGFLYLVSWIPMVHARMMPGQHWTWLIKDIAAPLASGLVAGVLAVVMLPASGNRMVLGAEVVVAAIAVLAASACSTSATRMMFFRMSDWFWLARRHG